MDMGSSALFALTLGACSSLESIPTAAIEPHAPRPGPSSSSCGELVEAAEIQPPPSDPSPLTNTRRVTIAATGDLVFSRRLVTAWESRGDDGLSVMLQGFTQLLDENELVVVNLETPLVDNVVPLSTGWPPVIGAPPGVARVLADEGVDIVSLANNHAYDQGHLGLTRTMDILDSAGIVHVGAGTTREEAWAAEIVEHGDLRIAFMSFTGPMNLQISAHGTARAYVARLWDEERVLATIANARSQADVLVACFHWSRDFANHVSRAQREQARRFVDAGVDVILGTGPHVLHSVETMDSPRGTAVVAYSLGNLLSSMAFRWQPGTPPPTGYIHPANVVPNARDGVLLRVNIEVTTAGHLDVLDISGVPLWTVNNYQEHVSNGEALDIRVVPLSEAPSMAREERGRAIADALGDAVRLEL